MDIAILLVLIVLNGVFAMSEIALVSSRKGRLERAAERGQRGAAAALELAESPTRFLSTVQVGITLIGIFAGAFGEAAISGDLAAVLARWPALAPYSEGLATVLVVLGITYLSLVIGELVPKRIGMASPERIASAVARPMTWVARTGAPVVWLLSASTDLIVRLFGKRMAEEHPVTEEDIKGMIEQATETGAVIPAEQELVTRVFRAGDLKARSLMVPRPEIESLRADDPPERVRIAVATSMHSHFPVCRKDLDSIVGIVHVKDLVKAGLLGASVDLEAIARPPLYVPETMPALKLLETFKKERVRIAIVVDEYGVVEGLVTVNDIVEAIVGEASLAGEEADLLAVRRPDGSWLLDGSLEIDDLREVIGGRTLPGAPDEYRTLGGLIVTHLGHIPATGEAFEWGGYRFEIVDMDRRRVDRVLLTPLATPATPEEADGRE